VPSSTRNDYEWLPGWGRAHRLSAQNISSGTCPATTSMASRTDGFGEVRPSFEPALEELPQLLGRVRLVAPVAA